MGYFITGIFTRRRVSTPPKCGSCWFCVADILALKYSCSACSARVTATMELSLGYVASYQSISGTCISDVSPPFGGHNGLFIPYLRYIRDDSRHRWVVGGTVP